MTRHIVVIETPIFQKSFKQVVCLMSEEELEGAKKERPDLIFKVTDDYPDEMFQESLADQNAKMIEEQDRRLANKSAIDRMNSQDKTGITVKGITLPSNIDYLINQVLKGD